MLNSVWSWIVANSAVIQPLFWNTVFVWILYNVVPTIGKFLYEWLASHIESKKLREILEKGAVAVAAVEQEYVKGIKKGREDGNLTPEEEREARRRAVAFLISMAKDGISETFATAVVEANINSTKDPKSALKERL